MNVIDSPLLGLSQRIPPANMQAEQALLGALLANNRAYERVAEFLAPEHFADPIHGRIYAAIHRRVNNGQLADAITLRAEFEHTGVLDEVGGTAYLAQLLTAMVGIINAGEYGRAVHDSWLRRELIEVGEEVVNNAFGADAELDGKQQVEAAEQRLFDIADKGASVRRLHRRSSSALTAAIQGADRAFHRPGHVSGLSTGLRDLDKKMGGLHPSDLLIMAGRPGMGKIRAGHQDRVRRCAVAAGARRRRRGRAGRAEGQRRLLLAGDERRADRAAPAGRGGAGVGRPHPPRRHRAAGFRHLRAGQPRDRRAAAAYRRDAGHVGRRAAHAVPAAEADARA